MYEKNRTSVRDPSANEAEGHGKITSGLVTTEMVETRARELALIAGRAPNLVSASDRIQAKKELLGDDSADAAVDDTGITPGGMGYPPVSTGTHTKNHLPTDDQMEMDLVQEGLDQAEHEEMLQAAKTRTKNEG
jgi:hypothetical protein